MSTYIERTHRKNGDGTYDVIYRETTSKAVVRPDGRNLEDDLTQHMPDIKTGDTTPDTLNQGKIMQGDSKTWVGIKDNSPKRLINEMDSPVMYENLEEDIMKPDINLTTIDAATIDGMDKDALADYVVDTKLTDYVKYTDEGLVWKRVGTYNVDSGEPKSYKSAGINNTLWSVNISTELKDAKMLLLIAHDFIMNADHVDGRTDVIYIKFEDDDFSQYGGMPSIFEIPSVSDNIKINQTSPYSVLYAAGSGQDNGDMIFVNIITSNRREAGDVLSLKLLYDTNEDTTITNLKVTGIVDVYKLAPATVRSEDGSNLTDKVSELESRLNDCFTSVSNGKKLIASTLADNDITIAQDATFEEFNEAIKTVMETTNSFTALSSDGTATPITGMITGDDGSGYVLWPFSETNKYESNDYRYNVTLDSVHQIIGRVYGLDAYVKIPYIKKYGNEFIRVDRSRTSGDWQSGISGNVLRFNDFGFHDDYGTQYAYFQKNYPIYNMQVSGLVYNRDCWIDYVSDGLYHAIYMWGHSEGLMVYGPVTKKYYKFRNQMAYDYDNKRFATFSSGPALGATIDNPEIGQVNTYDSSQMMESANHDRVFNSTYIITRTEDPSTGVTTDTIDFYDPETSTTQVIFTITITKTNFTLDELWGKATS